MHFGTGPNRSKFVKFGIGTPGPQSAPRGNETATFANGFVHILFIAAVVITVGTFKVAEKQPWRFGSYHSYGRSRGYVVYRDAQGNPYKVPLDKDDPGGEHE